MQEHQYCMRWSPYCNTHYTKYTLYIIYISPQSTLINAVFCCSSGIIQFVVSDQVLVYSIFSLVLPYIDRLVLRAVHMVT